MIESRSSNLIKSAELKALKEISDYSELDKGLITKSEVIDRIEDINKSLYGFDLVIESKAFRELISITGATPPQLNDRLVVALETFFVSLEHKESNIIAVIEKTLKRLFEWDPEILERININIVDLKIFANLFSESEYQEFTRKLIGKYPFQNIRYQKASSDLDNDTTQINKFFLTSAFISEIGPLISIMESIEKGKNDSETRMGILFGLTMYVLDQFGLPSLYLIDLIPTLIRAQVRTMGIPEDEVLKLRTFELLEKVRNTSIGEGLIGISKAIYSKQKDIILNSKIGIRIWTELIEQKFWEKLEYLPKLSMLENISEIRPKIKKPEKPAREHLHENDGELKNILFN